MRAWHFGIHCLLLAACASSQVKATQLPVVPPPLETQQPVSAPSPPAPQATAPEPIPSNPNEAPWDDPNAARRYGYPPGTILRFSRSIDISPPYSISPVNRPRPVRAALRLLVFRQCADDNICRDEVVLREPDAGPLALEPVHFSPDTGLIEEVKTVSKGCVEGETCSAVVFELTVVSGSERSVFCLWPWPPHQTKALAIQADGIQRHCREEDRPK
jgi:hypothetical protein